MTDDLWMTALQSLVTYFKVPERKSERRCGEQGWLGRDLAGDLEARLLCELVTRSVSCQLVREPGHGGSRDRDHGADQTRDADPGPRHELLLHAG